MRKRRWGSVLPPVARTDSMAAVSGSDPHRHFPRLDRALEAAIGPYQRGRGPLTVLFSGGVDSSVLAWELRQRGSVVLSTVGRPESPDLRAARSASALLGLLWNGTALSDSDLRRTASRWAREFEPVAPSRRSIFLALALAIERAPPGAILCGQGPDELFLGYAHFRGLDLEATRRRAADDLERLLREDWPRTVDLARKAGREIAAPFLHPEFVHAALEIPLEERLPRSRPKGLWRDWARHRGVPEEIAERPKRALQYGSGIDRWGRRAAADYPA